MDSKFNTKLSIDPNKPKKLSRTTKPFVSSGHSAPIRKVAVKNHKMGAENRNDSFGNEEVVDLLQYGVNREKIEILPGVTIDCENEDKKKEKLQVLESITQHRKLTDSDDYERIVDITPPPEFYFSDPVSSYEDPMTMWVTKEDEEIALLNLFAKMHDNNKIVCPSFYEKDTVKEITSMDLFEKNHEKKEFKLEEIGKQGNILNTKTSMTVIYTSPITRKESCLLSSRFTNASDEKLKHKELIKQDGVFISRSLLNEIGIYSVTSDKSSTRISTAPTVHNVEGNVAIESKMYGCKMRIIKKSCDLDKSVGQRKEKYRLLRSLDLKKPSWVMEKLKCEEEDRQKDMLIAKFPMSHISTSSIISEESSSFISSDTNDSLNSLNRINARLLNSMSQSTREGSIAFKWNMHGRGFDRKINTTFCITPKIEIKRTAPLNKFFKNDSESSAHVKMFFKYSEVRRCQIVKSPEIFRPPKQSQLIEASAASEQFLEESKQPRRTHPQPISSYALDICRKPLQCPEIKCNQLVDFPEFITHLIDEHTSPRMERISAGECKTVFLNINNVSSSTEYHAIFLVRDRLMDVTRGKYGDLLPIIIMSRYVHIRDIIGYCVPQNYDDVIVESKNDILLFLWPVSIIEREIPLKVSITIWPIGDRCVENAICFVGDVFSLRTPATIDNLMRSANLIILNAEQIKTLTNDGKQLIPLQLIVE